MTNNVFGVDLGTCNIKIYDRHADQIYKEKNIIAIANKKDVFAIGDEAFETVSYTHLDVYKRQICAWVL